MLLGADPTIKFATGKLKASRILTNDKNIDSEYNTYRKRGLPPGPINIPHPQFIDAVLNYEKHKYLYFCAKEDFSGSHYFSKNQKEHLIRARRYQSKLNSCNIFK